MSILIFLGIICLIAFFPYIRIVIFNFPKWLILSLKDISNFIFKMQFNVCPTGKIICYSGLFGYGKTLSVVHKIVSLYNRYNNKKCFVNGKFRIQKIVILSNVNLITIPYIKFTSLSQITEFTEKKPDLDGSNFWYVLLVLGDEFSTCLNSRNFKSNIDPIFLNTLVTARHYAISLYYTSQRFHLVDKLLRDVTFFVVQCKKIGRVELNITYDAWDMENASNPALIKSRTRSGFLVTRADLEAYDTFAVVDNLVKAAQSGDMLSAGEILEKLNPADGSVDRVTRLSFYSKRISRKRGQGR